MSHQKIDAYEQARREAHDLLQGSAPVKVFNVGKTRITLSKVRKLESEAGLPEPFPKMDIKPGEDFDSWMK